MTLMTWVTDQDLINYGFDQSARTIIRQGISEYKREYPEDRHFQSSSDSNVESASYSSSATTRRSTWGIRSKHAKKEQQFLSATENQSISNEQGGHIGKET